MTIVAHPRRRAAVMALVGIALGLAAESALAKGKKGKPTGKPDAALACVAAKQREAGKYCASVLRAWAKFEKGGDADKRDAVVAIAASRLEESWSKVEDKSSAAGTDCAAAFLTSSAAGTFIDSATGALVGEVATGLDPGTRAHAKCGERILKAAALKCQALLGAESLYQRERAKASATDRRARAIENASERFAKAFAKATKSKSKCPTAATEAGIEARVDAIAAGVVRDTLTSPQAGDGEFLGVSVGETTYEGRTFNPVCLNGTPYRFWARRGTVNKLVVYYQGGGACWEQLTCSIPTCDAEVTDADNPGNVESGLADLANPANPFREWNTVFVSYCSCDVHFGDAAQDYDNFNSANPKHAEHRGYHNARVVEKWAREHFLAPEEVFVTGSSAGAYGAWFNAPLLHRVWPSARFHVLADAGNGVVTQDFLDAYFPNWNFEGNLPSDIPELKQVLDSGEGIPGYTRVIAAEFPDTNWAHYSAAFDGGTGGQTGFYNLMLNGNDPIAALSWWEGSCAFRNAMQSQAVATAAAIDAANANYRYYIGSGSRHTMWGSDKVYSDTSGGVPTIVDWVAAMLASGPGSPAAGWTNVEAAPYNVVLPGDPRPNPLQAPFTMAGGQTLIDCAVP